MKKADLLIQNTKSNGYTLIEICIVTLIVGILTSLAMTGQAKLATRARLIEANALINAGLKNTFYFTNKTFWMPARAAKIWA